MNKPEDNLDSLNFETALARLETIVERLANEKIELEQMVKLYQEGINLKEHCTKKLSEAKLKVEILLKKENEQ